MTVPDRNWETSRLLAKPAAVADAQVVFDEYASDPAVAKYMTWTPHQSIDDTKAFLDQRERAWDDGSEFAWTLWHKDRGQFVGVLGMRLRSSAVDIGYAMARRWWRQGLMSEAVTSIVAWALSRPSIYRVWATCDVDNVASARLLERVGMQREGLLRRWIVHPNLDAAPRDAWCYAVVKDVTASQSATSDTIRAATTRDVADLQVLFGHLTGSDVDRQAVEDRLRMVAASAIDELYLLEDERGVQGLLGFRIRENVEDVSRFGEVTAIAVNPSARRNGHGRALMAFAEDLARRRGCKGTWLVSGYGREQEAHAFYRQLGYRDTGSRFVKSLKP